MTAVTPSRKALLACPFCNADSVGVEHDGSIFAGQTYPGHSKSEGWKIRCDGCGNQTAWWHSEIDAREAWNTRVAAKPADEEALNEALELGIYWAQEGGRGGQGLTKTAACNAVKIISDAKHALSTTGEPKR